MKLPAGSRKILKYLVILLVVLSFFYYFLFAFPFRGAPFNAQRHGNPPLTPPWALECWLWEDDKNTSARVDTLLQGYAKYDVPVRTVILDSPWSLRYNDFEIDTLLYPKPKEWFKKMQDNGYRVVMWMTTMVNSESQDTRVKHSEPWYSEAKAKGYLAADGDQIKWWTCVCRLSPPRMAKAWSCVFWTRAACGSAFPTWASSVMTRKPLKS